MKIAYLWQTENLGLYSNSDFDSLYKGVGHNNGNLAFVHAIQSHLGDDFGWYPWHSSAKTLSKEADIIVIPCANQLGAHTDLGDMADRLEATGLPIVAIGLGAQAKTLDSDVELKEGTLRFAQVIANSAVGKPGSNIYTRGPYTTSQLEKLGIKNSVPGGCPSFFMNPSPYLGQVIAADWERNAMPRSIAVAGGHQAWGKTRTVEHQLISMMMDPLFPGEYIVQSMGDMIKISRGLFSEIDELPLSNIHKHTVPHYTREEFYTWCNKYARSYYGIDAWMDSLRRYDLVVGSRYHGIALALQAGKMGLTVTIDSRTAEMCKETGVPYIPVENIDKPVTRLNLQGMVKFNADKYDALRQKKAKLYTDFLTNNGLKYKSFLGDIAAEYTPPSKPKAIVEEVSLT